MKTRNINYEEINEKAIEYKDKDKNEVLDEDEDIHEDFVLNNNFFNKIGETIIDCFSIMFKLLQFFINISGIYILWIFLHYIASHLYVKLCVPNTVMGFLLSPFMTATPYCQGLRWIIYNGANMINNMWIILGTWIAANFLIINKDNNNNNL